MCLKDSSSAYSELSLCHVDKMSTASSQSPSPENSGIDVMSSSYLSPSASDYAHSTVVSSQRSLTPGSGDFPSPSHFSPAPRTLSNELCDPSFYPDSYHVLPATGVRLPSISARTSAQTSVAEGSECSMPYSDNTQQWSFTAIEPPSSQEFDYSMPGAFANSCNTGAVQSPSQSLLHDELDVCKPLDDVCSMSLWSLAAHIPRSLSNEPQDIPPPSRPPGSVPSRPGTPEPRRPRPLRPSANSERHLRARIDGDPSCSGSGSGSGSNSDSAALPRYAQLYKASISCNFANNGIISSQREQVSAESVADDIQHASAPLLQPPGSPTCDVHDEICPAASRRTNCSVDSECANTLPSSRSSPNDRLSCSEPQVHTQSQPQPPSYVQHPISVPAVFSRVNADRLFRHILVPPSTKLGLVQSPLGSPLLVDSLASCAAVNVVKSSLTGPVLNSGGSLICRDGRAVEERLRSPIQKLPEPEVVPRAQLDIRRVVEIDTVDVAGDFCGLVRCADQLTARSDEDVTLQYTSSDATSCHTINRGEPTCIVLEDSVSYATGPPKAESDYKKAARNPDLYLKAGTREKTSSYASNVNDEVRTVAPSSDTSDDGELFIVTKCIHLMFSP